MRLLYARQQDNDSEILPKRQESQEFRDAWELESFKAMVNFALSFIKGIFIANTGAIAVLLAYTSKNSQDNDSIKSAVITFVLGIIAATLVSFFSYCSQCCYTHNFNIRGRLMRGGL